MKDKITVNDSKDLNKLVPDSQDIVQNFLNTYSKKSHAQTKTAIRTIVTETAVYDFSALTYADYTHFFNDTTKKITGNKYSTIREFFKYLYCYNILKNESGFEQCFWNKEKERIRFEKKLSQSNSQKNSKSKPNTYTPALTMEQLERLMLFEQESTHNYEKNFKNQRLAFCFHLLFFEDIQVSTIRNLDAKNFNAGALISDEKKLDIPEIYWDMLNYYKERPYSGFSLLDEYIRQLGDIVGIKGLVPTNISQKRKQNLFTCPECGKSTLSFSNYWKSVNGTLVCNNCAERLVLSGQKKI